MALWYRRSSLQEDNAKPAIPVVKIAPRGLDCGLLLADVVRSRFVLSAPTNTLGPTKETMDRNAADLERLGDLGRPHTRAKVLASWV